jgi:tetratricopeptide (TPR) repeat protein
VASLQCAERRERLGQVSVPSVQALAFLASCHAEQGRFAEGAALGEEGMQIAEPVAHPSSLMWACYGIGLLALCQGDLPRALPALERAMGVCREADLPVFVPRLAAALGAAHTLAGRIAEAIALLLQAMERTIASDMAGFQALCRLPRASSATSRRGPPERDQAEAHYRQALAVAEELGMRPLQAHCYRALGMLYAKIDRQAPACPELSAAFALYRAMDMTYWLPQAQAALAQVEGR